jgi:antitoxin FitA
MPWLAFSRAHDINPPRSPGKRETPLLIRKISDDLKERLRRRALRHGRSLGAEVREIVRNALMTDEAAPIGLGSRIAARFKRIGLREGEEFSPLRGYMIRKPFEE